MLRLLPIVLLPLAGLGCVDMDLHRREAASRTPTTASVASAPITADQVTAENARPMSHALWAEMDREEMAPASIADQKHK